MLSHVLIGVDGSHESKYAASFGLSLAEQTGARVTLVYVLESPAVIPVGPLSGYVMTTAPRSPEDLQRAKVELDDLVKEMPNVHCEKRVVPGAPAETLCDLARDLQADLLVLGDRGLGASRRFLLGSVTDRVVHHAPCAVMVVREKKSA
jgi:nucleotide-binding universal stress UspA family protein